MESMQIDMPFPGSSGERAGPSARESTQRRAREWQMIAASWMPLYTGSGNVGTSLHPSVGSLSRTDHL